MNQTKRIQNDKSDKNTGKITEESNNFTVTKGNSTIDAASNIRQEHILPIYAKNNENDQQIINNAVLQIKSLQQQHESIVELKQ